MRTSRGKSVALLCIAVLGSCMLATARPGQEGKPAGLSVGIFDSRAVAIAWARSEVFGAALSKKRAEHERAKEEGDLARAQEIEAEMPVLQEELHKQGFSIWPVRNILAHIAGDLENIAAEAEVDVIVCKWDLAYRRPKAEFVDVTHLMVEPFEPDEATLKILKEIRSQEPVPLPPWRAFEARSRNEERPLETGKMRAATAPISGDRPQPTTRVDVRGDRRGGRESARTHFP